MIIFTTKFTALDQKNHSIRKPLDFEEIFLKLNKIK